MRHSFASQHRGRDRNGKEKIMPTAYVPQRYPLYASGFSDRPEERHGLVIGWAVQEDRDGAVPAIWIPVLISVDRGRGPLAGGLLDPRAEGQYHITAPE
jgi:hypothetical protein